MSFKIQIARNLGYVGTTHIFTLLIRTITLLILARLLIPDDFGIVAIGLFVLNALNQISDLGVMSAIIHKQDGREKAISTGFFMRFGFGLCAYLAIALTVPYWATMFGNDAIIDVVRVISLSIIISSFGFGSLIKLNLALDFKKISIAQGIMNLVYGVVAVASAFMGYGYWSMVYGELFSWLVWAIVIYILAPWHITFGFDLYLAKDLLNYGKHILASALVIFAITNLDDVIIGTTLGLWILGLYYIAYKWGTIAATQLTQVVNRVMFPTYSKIRENPEVLKSAYLKTLHYVTFLSIPISVGLIVIASDFITYVIGRKWMPALLPLILLCVFGLLRSISANSGSVFKAVGRPDMLFKISLTSLFLKLIMIFSVIYLGFGIVGVAFAVTSSSIFITQVNVYYSCKYTRSSVREVLTSLWSPSVSSVVMAITLLIIKQFVAIENLAHLILLVFLGFFIYLCAMYIISPHTIKEVCYTCKKILFP